MPQVTVGNTLPGLQRGQLVGPENRIVTRFNARAETRTVTITYDAAGSYYLTIVGIPYDGGGQQTVTLGPIAGITDSATTAAAMKTAIEASAVAKSIVAVTRSSNVLTLVARHSGGLTVTESHSGGSSNQVVATTVSEQQLEAGVMVVRDTLGDLYIKQPAAGSVDYDGITLWPKVRDVGQSLTGNNVWPAGFDVNIIKKGIIGVILDGAVTPASSVFFRHAANGANTILGAFRADSDSSNATQVANGAARFLKTGAAGDVVPLEISLP